MSNQTTVHWRRKWQGEPMLAPSECDHGDGLAINQRLEPHGKGHRMACDGIVCMKCGSDPLKRLPLGIAFALCMNEHGWNREVGLRLHELAKFRQSALMLEAQVPIWCLSAWGLSGKEIQEALNRQAEAMQNEAA